MQIVIDIPELLYKGIKNGLDCGNHTLNRAIANGVEVGITEDKDEFMQIYCRHCGAKFRVGLLREVGEQDG